MDAEYSFIKCLLTGLFGFFLSLLAEKSVKPQLSFKRPWQAWLIHFALWSILFSCLALITGRPFCAAGFALAFNIILVSVNNAKFKSMREPFLYQDYDYFIDTLRFPRLFLPFLGLRSFCLCACGVLAALLALWAEPASQARWRLNGQAGASLLFLSGGLVSFFLAKKFSPSLNLSPIKDLQNLGFLAFLGFYGIEGHKKEFPAPPPAQWIPPNINRFPHLVAIQSESFFDCRQCWPDLAKNIYAPLDNFTGEAFLYGDLLVPAWGANTERSEFSFLTGISPAMLGAGRFNPYQLIKAGWHVPALPAFLRSAGYRTICIHPYIKAFYGRDQIFPGFGFDVFLDITSFKNSDYTGPYIGDLAISEKIIEIHKSAKEPTFIFAITMENHGPLHLEKAPDESAGLFRKMPPASCGEMGIYLRHARNAGLMLKNLQKAWHKMNKPVSLCFYGDHVPIMPATWQALGFPSGSVPYFCWSNAKERATGPQLLTCSQLAGAWLSGLANTENDLKK